MLLRRIAHFAAFHAEIHTGIAILPGSQLHHQRQGDFAQKARGNSWFTWSTTKLAAITGPTECKLLFGAGEADVTQAPFLFHLRRVVQRAAVREQTIFEAGDKHDGKFQALGIVHGEQAHLRGLVDIVRLRD